VEAALFMRRHTFSQYPTVTEHGLNRAVAPKPLQFQFQNPRRLRFWLFFAWVRRLGLFSTRENWAAICLGLPFCHKTLDGLFATAYQSYLLKTTVKDVTIGNIYTHVMQRPWLGVKKFD
jgi:hypothetical protein